MDAASDVDVCMIPQCFDAATAFRRIVQLMAGGDVFRGRMRSTLYGWKLD